MPFFQVKNKVTVNSGVTDDSVKHHIRVFAEKWIPAWQTVGLTITSEYETTKVQDSETTKVRNCENAKKWKYETSNESTKQQKYETVKQRKSDIAKQWKGDAKLWKGGS